MAPSFNMFYTIPVCPHTQEHLVFQTHRTNANILKNLNFIIVFKNLTSTTSRKFDLEEITFPKRLT